MYIEYIFIFSQLFFSSIYSVLFLKHYFIHDVICFIISTRFPRFSRNKFLFNLFNSRISSTTIDLTCFADPIEVTIQFALKLLLSSQLQEGLPVLHFLSLLRKLSTSVIQMTAYSGA